MITYFSLEMKREVAIDNWLLLMSKNKQQSVVDKVIKTKIYIIQHSVICSNNSYIRRIYNGR